MAQLDVPTISAGPPATPAKTAGSLRVCLAAIGGELFAIDLRYIREVFPVEHVTPVPRMPSVIVGVANLRGTIMPLVDVRAALGTVSSTGGQKIAIVIKHGQQQVGLLVDDVPEIRTVSQEDFLTAPMSQEQGAGARPFVSAILPVEGRMGGVVEVPTLLAKVEAG